MKGFKAEGIILKRKDFGEADRLLTVYTLQRGKIKVLAKGVRRITSRRAGNVELLNKVVMYLHPDKNFLILTEATAVAVFDTIKADLTLSTYAYHLIEIVDKLTAENQPDPILYSDLVQILSRLNKNPRQILVRAFEAKLLTHLGFANFESLSLHLQGSTNIQKLFKQIETNSWDQIEQLEINSIEAMELKDTLHNAIERILESSLKSLKMLRQLKKG